MCGRVDSGALPALQYDGRTTVSREGAAVEIYMHDYARLSPDEKKRVHEEFERAMTAHRKPSLLGRFQKFVRHLLSAAR